MLAGFLFVPSVRAPAEVLDKLVAVINGKTIITLSDVRKERAILTALDDKPLNDEAVLQEMIERHLVEEQIAQFPEIDIPRDQVEERLRQVSDPGGVSSADLRAAIEAQMRRLEFFIVRFRQFIRTSDEEIRGYYDAVFSPAMRDAGQPIPPLDQVRDEIQRNVAGEKMNEEVKAWLEGLRRRNYVEIFP